MFVIERNELQSLIAALQQRGYSVVGPKLNGGAITIDEISSLSDFPVGWKDAQAPGSYKLQQSEDQTLFSYNVGPHSWKKYLFPATLRLFKARKNGKSFVVDTTGENGAGKYAFLGVRSCDLHGIMIQDRVRNDGEYIDPYYRAMREKIFIVAANCVYVGKMCFCASMGTGPRATRGFDIALTELQQKGEHFFFVEVGSEKGRELMSAVPHRVAERRHSDAAQAAMAKAGRQFTKSLDTAGLETFLPKTSEHARWDDVAQRCLSCANCTLVCPTCFCSTVEDVTDLSGREAERIRKWDSCFMLEFSYIHGGNVRQSVKSRYRQWLTHKLASWVDQFGTSGCVGCGRCITWCPVGIDITEEVKALRESRSSHQS
jgi:sulfhydrogenase subunit beta (sulfur reductase)